ncbi:MAG: HEAT repeat domain-containing protein [Synechococcus sp. SB0676_bin_10]|uniref:HEAT repeat domain-containing protein n=1 Tax=Synechococcus sp. SB0676_bin_10 TaxID=2604869 RepID=A0A6B1F8K8_9SYNE|nr:HEAT repeat domain-containing protein [Synechococcus sp. SB0676_bin_10]MYK06536.1 HEAT repeat domain-containing protein [Synechococcus sp. SB0670_bin_20]
MPPPVLWRASAYGCAEGAGQGRMTTGASTTVDPTRFQNLFPGLSQAEALATLRKPLEALEDVSDRYLAAAHLVNFPDERTIAALMTCAADDHPAQAQRIARRKAVESLARLGASQALPVIQACLNSEDVYLVENAVWALAELQAQPEAVTDTLLQLLKDGRQNRRVVAQTAARLGIQEAIAPLEALRREEDPLLVTAATAALARLTGNKDGLAALEDHLLHPDVTVRRAVIQDLMDAQAFDALAAIAAAPVSPVFRLRGVRHLADQQHRQGDAQAGVLLPLVDRILLDDPAAVTLVHRYDAPPSLDFLVQELYGTDFGRVYLAVATLMAAANADMLAALTRSFADRGWNDYGAHYHMIKLFGWLGNPQALPLVREALANRRPQFQKSRPAAALTLARLDPQHAETVLQDAACEGSFWELRYAALMGLEQLQLPAPSATLADSDWLVALRAEAMASNGPAHG